MKTIDLAREDHTLSDLLALAKRESVLIHSNSGEDFLLEPADDFDREVAALGRSERFVSLLKDRSSEPGGMPLAEARRKRAGETR